MFPSHDCNKPPKKQAGRLAPKQPSPSAMGTANAPARSIEECDAAARHLLADDAAYVWHPFTHPHLAGPPLPVVKAKDAYVWDMQGNRYIDAIGSWWVNIHGHGHPVLTTALRQAIQLDHIQFAGATHPQAVLLAKQLDAHYPSPPCKDASNHWRTFYSDNGSTAVEVALKIAYQYWQQADEPNRTRFLAMQGGYHGDTVGAMSVGPITKGPVNNDDDYTSNGFAEPFAPLCFPVDRIPYPEHYWGNDAIDQAEADSLDALDKYLDQHGHNTAAFIAEPILQGAGGMRLSRSQYWDAVLERLAAYNIVVIFDEVLTGFGRTGKLFAAEHLTNRPHIVCLSKGLTGGVLPLGVTLVQNSLYQAFHGDGASPQASHAFLHGHSFTGNPIACAVANASLQLFEHDNTLQKIAAMAALHTEQLTALHDKGLIYRPRTIGPMAAFNMGQPTARYDHPLRQTLTQQAQHNGILLRPWGNTAYFLPPVCLSPQDLTWVYTTLQAHCLS